MLRVKGFSILEIMIAVAILAALGLGIYRMQLSALAAAQQGLARQQAVRAASNLINQLTAANLVYQNNTAVTRNLTKAEAAYSDDTTLSTDCRAQQCTTDQIVSYLLYSWKSQLAPAMSLPAGNIRAILCQDGDFGIPTLTNPNCSGNGGYVVKIVWQSHLQDAESALLGAVSYVMLKVPSR